METDNIFNDKQCFPYRMLYNLFNVLIIIELLYTHLYVFKELTFYRGRQPESSRLRM